MPRSLRFRILYPCQYYVSPCKRKSSGDRVLRFRTFLEQVAKGGEKASELLTEQTGGSKDAKKEAIGQTEKVRLLHLHVSGNYILFALFPTPQRTA